MKNNHQKNKGGKKLLLSIGFIKGNVRKRTGIALQTEACRAGFAGLPGSSEKIV